MINERIGELAALITAISWTVTAMAFESAGRRVGSLAVNIIRLIIAFLIFCLLAMVRHGVPIPVNAPATVWFWLGLSGVVGFVLGDLFLFQAFVLIGSRVSMLIYASVPPLTAVLGWLILGETMGLENVIAMVITMTGISLVILKRSEPVPLSSTRIGFGRKGVVFTHPIKGILYAFGGALGQAGGLVLSKLGAPSYDPFAATQIRGIAGMIGFAIIVTLMGRWRMVGNAVRNLGAMREIGIGALFGPFFGVSVGLYAIQHASTGVASTIMALTPVLIIIPSVLIRKEQVTKREIAGAAVAVAGTALLFL